MLKGYYNALKGNMNFYRALIFRSSIPVAHI